LGSVSWRTRPLASDRAPTKSGWPTATAVIRCNLTSLGSEGTGGPRWSPDDRWIAFDTREAGSPDVYVISAQGGKPRQLTSEPSVEIQPGWSHDGRWIYFNSNRSGRMQVWKVAMAGGAAQQVTRQSGAEEVVPELRDVTPTRIWTVRGRWHLLLPARRGGEPRGAVLQLRHTQEERRVQL